VQTVGNQQERSFPLTSLIQLFTFYIALLVCLDSSKLKVRFTYLQIDSMDLWATVLLAGLFGSLIGASVGLGQIRKWRGMLFCGANGSIIGVLILAIYAAPAKPAQAISAALLPLLTTLVLRVRTS